MDIAARIRATGDSAGRTDNKNRFVCKVKCQGCREYIFSDEDLSGVEYVKTKRGSEWFFHSGCIGQVWTRGIV